VNPEGFCFAIASPSAPYLTTCVDFQVGKFLLPAGTDVMAPSWGVHHNARVWGPDAGEWRPARWLEGRSVNATKKDADGNLRFLPFLDGRQNCIGQHLAVVRVP
jgi:PHYB activation tagged suppressor 1